MTPPPDPSPTTFRVLPREPGVSATTAGSRALRANDLARAYQPRRAWAARLSIAWNLALASLFIATHLDQKLLAWIEQRWGVYDLAAVPIYSAIYFITFALLNYPIELGFGYLGERHFVLAKEGIRSWTRDWLLGIAQHGMMFLAGSCLIVSAQRFLPDGWLAAVAVVLLLLFLITSRFGTALLPRGLFQMELADAPTLARLSDLAGEQRRYLPPVLIYSAPGQRDFAGGLMGLGCRQVLLLSRPTIALASEAVLRFVVLREIARRRLHHLLLATLMGWAWAAGGMFVADRVIPLEFCATAVYVPWLALAFSIWMAVTQPILAYLSRRIEYSADRYYLRHGGSVKQMRIALEELSQRNLARTDPIPRRRTIFHPLPSVTHRLRKAEKFAAAHPEK